MFASDDSRREATTLAASTLVHGGAILLILLAAAPGVENRARPVPQSITVEIINAPRDAPPPAQPTPPQAAPASAPQAVPSPPLVAPTGPAIANLPPATAPVAPPATQPQAQSADGWQHPTHVLSPSRLSEPRNRPVARQIEAMPGYLRTEQLCQFEAMEQIAAANPKFAPDQVNIAALREPRSSGGLTEADGAAFRSNGRWYQLAFRCRISAGRPVVIGFEYRIGAPIPKRDWTDLGLPAAGDD